MQSNLKAMNGFWGLASWLHERIIALRDFVDVKSQIIFTFKEHKETDPLFRRILIGKCMVLQRNCTSNTALFHVITCLGRSGEYGKALDCRLQAIHEDISVKRAKSKMLQEISLKRIMIRGQYLKRGQDPELREQIFDYIIAKLAEDRQRVDQPLLFSGFVFWGLALL